MTHYQNTAFIKRTGVSPLEEQIYSILDSRIQYIDLQVKNYFNTYTTDATLAPTEEINYIDPSSANKLITNLDQILSYTEKLQTDLKLLQILKAWLKIETVQDILDLLTDNKYLNYSEETLEDLLKNKASFFYSIRMKRN